MPPRKSPRKSPNKSSRRLTPRGQTLDALTDRLVAGRDVTASLTYDRTNMDVSTPAERIRFNARKVNMESAGRAMAAASAENTYEWLNRIVRKKRRDIYYSKLRNSGVKRIVSEGDSWHLFPEFIKEVIDQLNDDPKLAIFSTDGAGDTLESIWAEKDHSNQGFQKSISTERPSIFLFNGGGNDLLQAKPGPDGQNIGSLYFHLKQFQSGMSAADLILPSVDLALDQVELRVRTIIGVALAFPFLKKIVFHGYDYPFPNNDLWLGKPMKKRGIVSASLQRQICILLMDRLHARLARVQQSFAATGKVFYVDVRNCVPNKSDWFDEIHPRSAGFKKIAAKIRVRL